MIEKQKNIYKSHRSVLEIDSSFFNNSDMVVYNLEIGNYYPGEDDHDLKIEKEEIVEYFIRDIVQGLYYEGTWAKGSINCVEGNNIYTIRFYKTHTTSWSRKCLSNRTWY